MCMALPPTDDVRHRKLGCSRQHSEVRSERLLRMVLATPNGCPTVPFGVSWAFLAAGAVTRNKIANSESATQTCKMEKHN